jgi:DNA polymerase
MTIALPPKSEDLVYGQKIKAGYGESTILADFDFETYSEADLIDVGMVVYSEHPSTEILSLAYDLKDKKGHRLWKPNDLLPFDLFEHVRSGKLVEAWNVAFEWYIWINVAIHKYNFPLLKPTQIRCAMGKARAYSLPGALKKCAEILGTTQKDKEGDRLLNKFSKPRKPTKDNPSLRIKPQDDTKDALRLYSYNLQDIKVESEISQLLPDLSEAENKFWFCERAINRRGFSVDMRSVENCISIVEETTEYYNKRLKKLTNGQLTEATKLAQMQKYIIDYYDFTLPNMQEETIISVMQDINTPSSVKQILEVRQALNSAAVKKLYALKRYSSADKRIYETSLYYGAHTGRSTGVGAQLKNFPNSGLELYKCHCGVYHSRTICPECMRENNKTLKEEWGMNAIEQVLHIASFKSRSLLNVYYQDVLGAISGCLRSLLVSASQYDLMASDYSAIEAVVLAALAEEEWRINLFNTHGKIYEMTASQILNIPFEVLIEHKLKTGQHHSSRKLGKVAELASGYQGAIKGWKNFGAAEFMTDEEIQTAVTRWRKANSKIVELWYGLERAAKLAIKNPGTEQRYKSIMYYTDLSSKHLYCVLPSKRILTYHSPRVAQNAYGETIYYWGWKKSRGWVEIDTFGGRLTENVTQAVARDILANAIVNCHYAGYSPVLEVYDEIVVEVPESFGSIAELENLMCQLPDWAKGWPIKARDGWRGKRYRK